MTDRSAHQAEGAKRQQEFRRLAEPFRRELHVHCYRMLGSIDEAEDLVQETYLRAWRGFDNFETIEGGSFRAWLYKISTNTCLNALANRKNGQRFLPHQLLANQYPNWRPSVALKPTPAAKASPALSGCMAKAGSGGPRGPTQRGRHSHNAAVARMVFWASRCHVLFQGSEVQWPSISARGSKWPTCFRGL